MFFIISNCVLRFLCYNTKEVLKMVLILYGFVVFLATLLGSFVGLGGGVIIKPVLDVINAHSLTEISFFSSCAVLRCR